MTLVDLLTDQVARTEIKDRLSLRIIDCSADLRENKDSATKKDLAVLIRQWIRRKDINVNIGSNVHVIPNELCEALDDELKDFGLERHETLDGRIGLTAKPWIPDWVRGASELNPVDQCSGEIVRRSISLIESDKGFKDLTGYQFYKSKGQFAACQMVRSMKNGSTTVVMLPTGSGKTEVALSLIENLVDVHPRIRDKPSIVSVLVVPYVSLIKDLDRRLVELYQKQWLGTGPLTFSYTYDTDSSKLESLLNRINSPDGSDIPGIIITSPESFVGRFRNELRNWAGSGRLGSLIFDEAHLLYQSGVGFRLDFRELAIIRDELNEVSPTGCKPRTLLMSATVGEIELKYFIDKFGPIDNVALIDAATLRSEPDIFVSKKLATDSREKYLVESLHHLPRPAIIYVTQPEDAKDLYKYLKGNGFGRLRCVVGETTSKDREEVLNSLRTGDLSSKCDLVVANSAFGLGIDCEEIRSVIHYCLPESVDRWYQEIGRGGRDGKSSVGLLITEGRKGTMDYRQAFSNVPKTLLIETLIKRWNALNALREVSKSDESRILLDLRTPHDAKVRRDWTELNGHTEYGMKWNRTILYALQELGLIELHRPSSEEIKQIRELGSTHFDWAVIVKKQGIDLGTSHFAHLWNQFRENLSKPFEDQLERMFRISSGEIGPCVGINATYEMPSDLVGSFKPCLQSESCKTDCGHCSSCFENGVPRSRFIPSMPFMSVVFEGFMERSMNNFLTELRDFWSEIANWRALEKPDVNILLINCGELSSDESDKFKKLLTKNQFRIYDPEEGSIDPGFLSDLKPQFPGPVFANSDDLRGNTINSYFRKNAYRKDLGVPLVLLNAQRFGELNIQTEQNVSPLDWQEPLQFDWSRRTAEMIRKLLEGRFNQ
jgi:ATP-dependent DNA helicase RecQ